MDADVTGPMPDGSSHEAWVFVLRAAMCRDGVDAMEKDARRAIETLEPYSSWQPSASLLLGIGCMLSGDLDEADRYLADAIETSEDRYALITLSIAFRRASLHRDPPRAMERRSGVGRSCVRPRRPRARPTLRGPWSGTCRRGAGRTPPP
jgi:hypothetical protein